MTPIPTFDIAMNRMQAGQKIVRLGVAVSGGGDSMALLRLARLWAGENGISLSVVTVDHGLRPGSADEAGFVARTCAAQGLPHETLRWQGWNGTGNLQDQARRARFELIAEWAHARDVDTVALGHTQGDQAETFLMRLKRGSGVDGLATMRRDWQAQGVRWLRPLADSGRQALRDYLTELGQDWCEDPTNEDARFDRVQARFALKALEPMGITPEKLAATSRRMGRARHALEFFTQEAARAHCTTDAGDVMVTRAGLAEMPMEIQMRLWAQALIWVSGAEYRPRETALTDAITGFARKRAHTLHGCLALPEGGQTRITREYQAVKVLSGPPDALWDGRWRLSGPPGDGQEVRALGEEGLDLCGNWRETGRKRATLLASPAVWRGDELVAAPLAGLENGWSAKIDHPRSDFFTSLLSH